MTEGLSGSEAGCGSNMDNLQVEVRAQQGQSNVIFELPSACIFLCPLDFTRNYMGSVLTNVA